MPSRFAFPGLSTGGFTETTLTHSGGTAPVSVKPLG